MECVFCLLVLSAFIVDTYSHLDLTSDVCTFELDFCHWTQPHDNLWRRVSGKASSTNTGPIADAHGSVTAHYIYMDATRHPNQVARLESQHYTGGDYCVDFYYHMDVRRTGFLRLNVVAGTHVYHIKTWSGNHGNHWTHQRLNARVHKSETFKFEFEGHADTSSHSGHIAIDDVIVHQGNC